MKDFNPIKPTPKDCVICMDGIAGREDFYSVQEGNIATLLANYKLKYEKITGEKATKMAIYYIDSVSATQIASINL